MHKMQDEGNETVFFVEQRRRDSATKLPEPMCRYGGRPAAALLPPRHLTDSTAVRAAQMCLRNHPAQLH